ncbi:hypothetical protein DC522_23620 [Microvirga sp. KLBC 81]|uniref:hypothetical protein n=1 Tax=Microvirga sp. KLBC 81 TaxID=1862707 RepID=UPI000D51C711|nr:hypothetical protein [Microvirga sp. KLBC 81]PVE22002.1 hypothetical protein DC522_23620 [Microvirga sp. KLBC 81]
MSDEINHRRSRLVETAAMTITRADQSSVSRTDSYSTQSVETHGMSDNGMNRMLRTDNTLYPAAVLAELSILVRSIQATSPDSALAAIAETKIGRSLALSDGYNPSRQGGSQCTAQPDLVSC